MRQSRLMVSRAVAVITASLFFAACGGTNIDVLPDASNDTPSTSDAPSSDAPAVDAPSNDVPSVDVPSVDAPSHDVPSVDAPSTSCFSTADCRSGQECVYADTGCARSGVCMGAIACAVAETFCSCTGETYQGCRPSRSTQARGACPSVDAGTDSGVTTCTSDRDCAAGQACCGFTGRCYNSACLACCMFAPPDAGPGSCTSNSQCAATQYCAGTGCGTAGTCAARPEACTTLYSPVCGCDGRTYSNDCVAAGNGARVLYRGECATTPDAGTDATVDAGEFCPAALCLAGTYCCEAARACIPMGALCIAPTPDAGTDATVDIPVTTGCTTAADCRASEECVFDSTGCARTGVCMPAIACLRAETFCSCSGVTYTGCRPSQPTRGVGACGTTPDAGVDASVDVGFCGLVRCAAGTVCCEAARACIPMGALCIAPTDAGTDSGVTTCTSDRDCATGMACCAGTGRCYDTRCLACCMFTVDAGPASCTSNSQCATTQYCAGTGCGTAGTCAARPDICTSLYSPVCGCDGRTYSNDCVAASAGARVASRGACL